MVETDLEIVEPELDQDIRHRGAQFRFDHRRRRAERIDVALIELAEAAARWTIGAPHRLDLVALEQPGQLALILRDNARERHSEVIAQGQVGLSSRLVLAALENLEYELVAFLAVLAEERLDVLDSRRFERFEAVALVDARDDGDDVLAAPYVLRQEIAHAARRFSALVTAAAASGPAASDISPSC